MSNEPDLKSLKRTYKWIYFKPNQLDSCKCGFLHTNEDIYLSIWQYGDSMETIKNTFDFCCVKCRRIVNRDKNND